MKESTSGSEKPTDPPPTYTGCRFCEIGDRPDWSPYLNRFIHRQNRDHLCENPPVADFQSLLCNLAQILDVVRQEWGESWSEWDQQQRDAISRIQMLNGSNKP